MYASQQMIDSLKKLFFVCHFFRIDESLCRVDSEDDGGMSHLDDSILTSGAQPGDRCETRATVEGW